MSAVGAKFALLCAVLCMVGAPCLGLYPEAELKDRAHLKFLCFFQLSHVCLPVAISCCSVGFKPLRTELKWLL